MLLSTTSSRGDEPDILSSISSEPLRTQKYFLNAFKTLRATISHNTVLLSYIIINFSAYGVGLIILKVQNYKAVILDRFILQRTFPAGIILNVRVLCKVLSFRVLHSNIFKRFEFLAKSSSKYRINNNRFFIGTLIRIVHEYLSKILTVTE
jgi:hypothetical protein